MEDGRYVEGSVWFFAPDKGAPVFFTAAFAASGIWHIWQCVHYKSWRLTGLYVFCAILFTTGFAIREIGAFQRENLDIFIASVVLIYAAPPVMELANYNVLGRILYFTPQYSPIHPGRVITTFAAISGIVEALNGNGASLSANPSLPRWKQDIGRALLKASLLIQVFVVLAFVALALVFHRRVHRAGLRNARITNALATLYVSTAVLLVRTLYRVVEYFSVADLHYDTTGGARFDPNTLSPLIRYEWFFYVFEASLMLVNMVLMNVRHPRRYLPQSTKVYLADDGVTEIVGPGYKEDRNFFVTVLDPFDLYGLIKGKDAGTRFWETQGPPKTGEVAKGRGEAAPRDPEA